MPHRARAKAATGPEAVAPGGAPPALAVTVLGIDPGLEATGYGLVRLVGQGWQARDFGVLPVGQRRDLPARLRYLYEAIAQLIAVGQPTAIALEDFVVGHVRAAVAIGEARAVVILAAAQAGVPVFLYQPAEVKQAVVGYGRGSKEQVQAMVRVHLGLAEPPQPADAADALAVALCHLIRQQAQQRLRAAVQS